MDQNEYKIWQTAKAQGKDDAFIKGAIQAYRARNVAPPPPAQPQPLIDRIVQSPISKGIQSFFPGAKLGGAIATSLAAANAATGGKLGLGDTGTARFSDVLAQNQAKPLSVAGDVGNIVLSTAGMAASAPTSLMGKVALGGALGYGADVSTSAANEEKNIFKPGWGTGLGVGIPLVSSLVGKLGKVVLSKTSGTGQDVLDTALKHPNEVNAAINEYATTPEAQQELVDKAKGAIDDFLQQRSAEYGKALEKLPSVKTGKQDVLKSFADKVSDFGGSVKNGQLTFTDTTLTKADQNNLRQAYSVINKWNDTSARGLDGLRQALGNYMKDFKIAGNPRANVVLGAVKDDLTKSLSKQVPGYTDMLKNYGTKTQTAQNLASELSIRGQGKPSTQLRAVMNLFKKDPSVMRNLETVMGKEAAQQFANEVSGAILSNWFPPGVVGNAARTLLQGAGTAIAATGGGAIPAVATTVGGIGAMSPRVVGKGAVLLGKANQLNVGAGLSRAATLMGGRMIPQPEQLSSTQQSQVGNQSYSNNTTFSPEVQRILNMRQ